MLIITLEAILILINNKYALLFKMLKNTSMLKKGLFVEEKVLKNFILILRYIERMQWNLHLYYGTLKAVNSEKTNMTHTHPPYKNRKVQHKP